jgi:serine/threonine protein kinase
VPGSCKIPKIVTDVSTAPISQSHFSDIWSGTLDGRKVAIKALRLHEDEREKVKKVSFALWLLLAITHSKEAYVHELVIWQYLRHPNIVPFVGTSQQFHVSLISEWMIGGTVSAFISNEPNCDRKMLVCIKTFCAIHYLMLTACDQGLRCGSRTIIHAHP